MTYELINADNLRIVVPWKFDLIYADMIYENINFFWVDKYWGALKWNGIFIVQTDYHTVAQMKLYLDNLDASTFVNWLIYKQEWGGTPRNRFPQKHDDILVYCKGKNWKWDKSGIQIPKVTAGTSLDKKGTGLKTPCSVFDDLGNFHTTSKERIKTSDGHNIQWQKPLKLMDRLLRPFTEENDWICDPFMGSGSTGRWCVQNNRNFVGIENNPEVFELAKQSIEELV